MKVIVMIPSLWTVTVVSDARIDSEVYVTRELRVKVKKIGSTLLVDGY